MCRLFDARVLMSGMQGLGAEIAKNIILVGIKSVTLRDVWDMSINFVFSEQQDNEYLAPVRLTKFLYNLCLKLCDLNYLLNHNCILLQTFDNARFFNLHRTNTFIASSITHIRRRNHRIIN
ncbi:unnamed protein product [Vicia faba]|uniref:THIF-type NAD/FAD binding fold domain-containing protein n=1 Tax=Vicia faba TaxID=3906 RepID=A0AAV1AXQ6_VICFA|nr:unnamed protein product [Vicia faba]